MRPTFLLLLLSLVTTAAAAEEAPQAIEDYEARLEEISREIEEIRTEMERLVEDVVYRETARVFIFVEGPTETLVAGGITLRVDEKTVFSRQFTSSELEFAERGLPIEVADLRLSAGEHRVELLLPGMEGTEASTLSAPRGGIASWVARFGDMGTEWRTE